MVDSFTYFYITKFLSKSKYKTNLHILEELQYLFLANPLCQGDHLI